MFKKIVNPDSEALQEKHKLMRKKMKAILNNSMGSSTKLNVLDVIFFILPL